MELHHLEKFVVLAEELHFGRAAARLHMAQSPLSQQIRNLETDLGVDLFERTTRRVTLTSAGRAFLAEARAALAQVDRARVVASSVAAGRRGHLRVTFVGSAAFALLPRLLRAYRRTAPDVDVELCENTSAEQLDALLAGHAQVGLVRSAQPRPGLRFEVLATEPLLVALPRDHALAAEPEIRLAALASDPFILFPRGQGPALYDLLLSLCQRAGFAPRIAQVSRHMATTASLVAAGLGVSLVPASVRALRPDDVVYRPVAGNSAWVDLVLAWHADRETELLRGFLDCARAIASQVTWPVPR